VFNIDCNAVLFPVGDIMCNGECLLRVHGFSETASEHLT